VLRLSVQLAVRAPLLLPPTACPSPPPPPLPTYYGYTYHGYTYYRYERFCSAFPDVDSPFGGAGDFFGADFKEGSFEVRIRARFKVRVRVRVRVVG